MKIALFRPQNENREPRSENHEITPQPQKLLNKVIEYYHKTFFEDKRAMNFLANHEGITEKAAFAKLKVGYSNGTLHNTIPKEGQIVSLLRQIGILDITGREKFLDCIIFPIFDEQGNCIEIYGRRLNGQYPVHIYLRGQNRPLNLKEHLKTEESAQQTQENKEPDQPGLSKVEGEHTEALKDGLFIRYGQRKYLVRGIDSSNHQKLKVNLKAINENPSTSLRASRFHIDTIDLYVAKQRKAFAREAELLFREEAQVIEDDLNRIIEHTESYIAGKKENILNPYVIPEKEKERALSFLKSPELIELILKDFETIGCAGERTNKLIGYLAAVSRKLEDPLSLLIISRSAAGKSLLQDSILELIPDEDKAKYTRITGQALFYKGENSLRHKVIGIEEEEGASQASYSIRIIQSSKFLTIATTIKDPLTGEMKTQEYHVKGPLVIILTTTRVDIDPETMNRFIVLTIDETREQTRLIHHLQREKDTLSGLLQDNGKESVIKKHHNAQRLLRSFKVVNPYAKYLTFTDERLRTRRDHKKYLSLIKAIAFLRQYQRPIKTVQHKDKAINYIEVTTEDISFANILANEVLGRSLDELAPASRRLLMLLKDMVKEKRANGQEKVYVSRRDIRDYTKWSDHQVRDHLRQLVDLEYVLALSGRNGSRYMYELIYDGGGEDGTKFLMGLTDLKSLRKRINENHNH